MQVSQTPRISLGPPLLGGNRTQPYDALIKVGDTLNKISADSGFSRPFADPGLSGIVHQKALANGRCIL